MIEPSLINCVIYHKNCSDGFGAAYSAWKLLGNKAEYIACTHGDTPPDVTGKRVAILDFSFDNKTTKEMIEKAEALVVIDHHKSAVVELHDINCTIFDMSKSGATMAWEFFHPAKETPKFIQYIEDRDLWKWEMPYSKEFSAAFDMVPWEFDAFEEFEDDSVIDDAIKRGSYILAYSKTVVKKICDKATRKKMFINQKDYEVMVVNSSHWMSEIGSTLSKDCDVAMIYYFDHDRKEYKVSLRAFHEHIDVSEISKHFGGGGHKKAAGFVLSGDIHPETLFQDIPEITEEVTEEEFDENNFGSD
jgi:nanoRNase/pAp phosphatase (c-di-AMP/oligoRNAs hydrolase)